MDRLLTRIEFIRIAAVGAAWCAAMGGAKDSDGVGPSETTEVMPRIPIGLQLYSVRNECAQDLPGVLAAGAAMGYEGVEFAGYHNRSAAELRTLLNESGLRCCGTHLAIDALTGDELPRTVEFNQILGNEFLIVASLADEWMSDRQRCLETARVFNEISQTVAAQGMRVGYHNHASDLRPLNGETAWDLFFANTRPEVVMQVDTANMLAGGGDPVLCLRKYPGRAATMHIKEHSKIDPAALPGEGDIDWQRLFEVVEAQGATRWYIVEHEGNAIPPLVAVERCLASFQRIGKMKAARRG
jgi:sugar phosphate isomerase/epimerase